MKVARARAKGRLRGKQRNLNHRQEAHLVAPFDGEDHSTAELADLFGVTRSTVLPRSGTGAGSRRCDLPVMRPDGDVPHVTPCGTATQRLRPRHSRRRSWFGRRAIYQSHLTSSWSQSGNRPVAAGNPLIPVRVKRPFVGFCGSDSPAASRADVVSCRDPDYASLDAPFQFVDVFPLGLKTG
jgi:hypothetical protein